MLHRAQKVAIAITVGTLVLLGGVVLYLRPRQAPLANSTPTQARSSPAEVAERYQVGLRAATADLQPFLERKLVASDQAPLAAIRDELVALTVPAAAQSLHLQLVLKVSLLRELLTPGTVTAAAHGVPSVSSTQAELKKLLTAPPALVQ